MVRLGYDLKDLYEYSLKEILFMLKYKREGLAYEIWRNGTMSRAAQAKDFPLTVEKAIPELFEKQEGVKLQDLPPEIQEMMKNNIQSVVDRTFTPR